MPSRKSSNPLTQASQSWASAGSLMTQTLGVPHPWGTGDLKTQCWCRAPPGDQVLSPSSWQAHPVLLSPGHTRPWGPLLPFARGTEKTGIC